ncbi:protein GREB1 isoform X3 [Tachysurus ichikawai]
MGNSYAGQLRTTRFEEVLHYSIEASLRSNTIVPRPVFSQLYLEPEQRPLSQEGQMENEEDDDDDGSETNSPPIPYHMKPAPEGSCTTDGFCQAGKDLRLTTMSTENLDVPLGFLLVGAKSPSIPGQILVCAVDRRFLPDERGRNALLGFSGNCMGCGEKGFRYFTEFSNHINLKLTTQPKKQKHLKYHLLRNAQGMLVKGPPICWKGIDSRVRQNSLNVTGGLEEQRSGSVASNPLPNSGPVGLSTANRAAVRGQVQLQKHTSVETLEIVQCLLGSTQHCPSHHGYMLLLRIPFPCLAALAHQRLCHIRDRLGLHKHFEIVLGDPSSGIIVGKHFLSQLRVWLKIQDPDWTPRTYLDLEALPCILIFTGLDPMGESLPRSLKYCDERVISCCALQRTALEQELGLAAYLVRVEEQRQHGLPVSSDLSESDPDKLSSTDNEEEESIVNAVSSALPGQEHSQQTQDEFSPNKPSQSSKSTSPGSFSSSQASPQRYCCSWAHNINRPPVVLLPKALYDLLTSVDASGLPKPMSFLPHPYVEWASSFRPLLSKIMTCTEQSLYYRQWTVPKPQHMDSSNWGRTDNFHPRRLLLSGPPQVGKTGAYLQFLGILSRMLIRLMEVDIFDEEDINHNCQSEVVKYHQANASWPNADTLRGMPFDFTIHDPKYEDISAVYSPDFTPNLERNPRRQEDVYLRRRTARIKLSKYAAYNTYHHCEQCHQYMGFNPRYQLCESTLHAFTFSHLLLGEEIQLYFIIPKSKEHHFSFSQPGGQLESMRLPLSSDWNPDCIKSPIFTPTTGRHEHGLFNLYHAMDGASHLHILVIKEYEMAVYKKYWPNHIMLVLPNIFNGAGIGAAHFLIKELSYHNLELERSRRVEHGSRPQDVWPFIILADDSCVMWNSVDIDPKSGTAGPERNVSLKQLLQHMESSPDITQYALCGLRKWSSRGAGTGRRREPFSHGHLHDFLLLNVDLTQNVQYNQNRFTCDDVDFNLRVHSAGLLIFRFNNFSVMKKQIAIGGYRTFIIKTKMTDVPTTVQPSQYICAPDSKHLFLATPGQLLLEKYLQHTSQRLFPLSTGNNSHPVLSVDCYLNLGPEITVCFVSSRPHSVNISTAGLFFSGLLLYFCDSFVTPGFLKKFQFLKGATLCVICPNRSALRQTVVRLELEDEWRFRLSDEFQTANAKEDQPLFFLTGTHI